MELQNRQEDKPLLYRFYVGSSNTTKKPEIYKAIKVLKNRLKGYTIIKNCVGLWENQAEQSFIIEVLSNKENPFNKKQATTIKNLLEKNLKQYLVLTTIQEINIL